MTSEDPVESGALEDEQDARQHPGEPLPTHDDPVESGALEDEQEGKGYGADEGEREESLEAEQ